MGLWTKRISAVETKAGIKYLHLTLKDGKVSEVRVNMGEPILNAKDIPVLSGKEQVIDEPIEVDGKEYRITGVSMGNPHAVVFHGSFVQRNWI